MYLNCALTSRLNLVGGDAPLVGVVAVDGLFVGLLLRFPPPHEVVPIQLHVGQTLEKQRTEGG